MPAGDGDEDGHNDGTCRRRRQQRLDKDGILNLAKRWLLDPDLAVKDLAHDIPLLVLGHPGLVFEAVVGSALEGFSADALI
jgi:hypothetical protein